MTWSDVQRAPSPRVLRQFAGALALLGLVLILTLPAGSTLFARGAGIALLLAGAVGVVVPTWLRWPFTVAMIVAFPIGFVISHLVLAVLFYGVFLPIGLGLRARGWDAMVRRNNRSTTSYWSPKSTPQDLRRYLRQY